MEFIGFIVVLVIIGFVWNLIVSGGAAALKAAQGQGSFSDNMSLQLQGMGPLEIRRVDFQAGEDDGGPRGVGIEVRGLIPIASATNLSVVTSVIDATVKDEVEPVLSNAEILQEEYSTAYQHRQDVGRVEPDQGFGSWVRVGALFPDFLYPAQGGIRKLIIVTRLVDSGHEPTIELGFCDSEQVGVVAVKHIEYEFDYQGKGYREAAAHRDEARALAIRLGLAVAIGDGTPLDEREGNVIKAWVIKTIAAFGESKRDHLRSVYNDAMRIAYADAKAGELSLSDATNRLNEIAEAPQKYEAIELCFDVMAADGVADAWEMESIRKIAEALQLDYQEIENLRDKRLIGLDVSLEHQSTLETLIGIDEGWGQDKIKTYIRTEYAKWNDRLNNLPEGQERENAQRMLDLLSEARKKYA